MSTAQDFIPTEAEIAVTRALFHDDVKNLATDEDITNFTIACVHENEARYIDRKSVV